MIIAGYSEAGKDSIEKWIANEDGKGYKKVWTSDIETPSYVDYDSDYLVALSASKEVGRLHYFTADGEGYKKSDELALETMGLAHISYMKKNRMVLASSYHKGVLVVAKVDDDKFDPNPVYITHEPGEDGLSRIHCAVSDAAEEYVYATNIAKDQIYVYKVIDRALVEEQVIQLAKGIGPRHIAIDEKRSKLYVMTEYSSEVIVIKKEGKAYSVEASLSTLPEDFDGRSDGGAIDISRDGRFLYVTNRGHDSIVCFSLEGQVKRQFFYGPVPHWPRHMSLITDEIIGVAGRRANKVELIKRDPESGKLLEVTDTFDFIEPSYIH